MHMYRLRPQHQRATFSPLVATRVALVKELEDKALHISRLGLVELSRLDASLFRRSFARA